MPILFRLAIPAALLCAQWATSTAAATLQADRLELPVGERAGQPSVTVDPREGFVLTWQERDGEAHALRYAVVDRSGTLLRQGTIARGTDWFVNGADFPNLAVLDNGDWVTFWLQKTSPGTYSYSIRSTRSRDAGARWDAPVTLHRDRTDTEHGFVSLVPAGDDRVRAVWLDGRRMAAASEPHAHGAAEHMTLRSAVLGRDGALSDEHELDDLTCACCQTDAVRSGSDVVVVYRNRSDAEVRDIHRVRWTGQRWTPPEPLHADGWTIAACPVNGPAIAAQERRVAAIWPSMASGEMHVAVRIDDQPPVALAEGADELGRVDIASWTDGRWLASRVSAEQRVPSLRLSLLDPDGRAIDEQTLAHKVGGYPRLARDGDVAVLVWAEAGDAPGSSRIGLARIRDAASR